MWCVVVVCCCLVLAVCCLLRTSGESLASTLIEDRGVAGEAAFATARVNQLSSELCASAAACFCTRTDRPAMSTGVTGLPGSV